VIVIGEQRDRGTISLFTRYNPPGSTAYCWAASFAALGCSRAPLRVSMAPWRLRLAFSGEGAEPLSSFVSELVTAGALAAALRPGPVCAGEDGEPLPPLDSELAAVGATALRSAYRLRGSALVCAPIPSFAGDFGLAIAALSAAAVSPRDLLCRRAERSLDLFCTRPHWIFFAPEALGFDGFEVAGGG
jgi:hypothetical protein